MPFPAILILPALVAPPPALPAPVRAVDAVMDDWHAAAAAADESRYFGHLADEAVFLGTDGTERWDKAAFQAFAHPYFAKGKAWTFRAVKRTVAFAAGGTVAWFDEDLDTTNMGPCRGSGVLELRKGVWKILQYNLSIPIPNPLTKDVTARIAAQPKAGS
jgi:ketosteroid isomerase-like protein